MIDCYPWRLHPAMWVCSWVFNPHRELCRDFIMMLKIPVRHCVSDTTMLGLGQLATFRAAVGSHSMVMKRWD